MKNQKKEKLGKKILWQLMSQNLQKSQLAVGHHLVQMIQLNQSQNKNLNIKIIMNHSKTKMERLLYNYQF